MFSSVVLASDYYYYDTLTIEQDFSNTLTVSPTQDNYFINDLKISLHSYPDADQRQEILFSDISSSGEVQNDKVIYSWLSPEELSFPYSASTKLKTTFNPVKITKKVDFPLNDVPPEVLQFLEHTDNIDSDKDIRQLANSLAVGKDDLFVLEFELAKWVNEHIEYNLSTLTSKANKPSTWVLKNEYGVCDEITNLFISLNRALGIPARFVSGIAYSDAIASGSKWGNHGWAEVYFPDYGWVSYDVTYGEFGYIDPTHISLLKSIDGVQASVSYESSGLFYTTSQSPLVMNTKLLSSGTRQTALTNVNLQVLNSFIKIGSYNLVTVVVENTQDYYLVEQIHLSEILELESINPWNQQVVLAPHERKKIFWTLKTDATLDSNYRYTFPMALTTSNGRTFESKFTVGKSWDMLNKDYVELFRDETEVEEVTTIPLDCVLPSAIVLNSVANITCSASEVPFSEFPLRGCLNNECYSLTTTHQTFSFTIYTQSIGFHTAPIKVTTKNDEMTFFNSYRVRDISKLEIVNASIPSESFVSDDLIIHFVIKKISLSPANGLSVKIKHPLFAQEWEFETLDEDREFDFVFPGNILLRGENNIEISAKYYDMLGNEYIENVTLTTTPLTQSTQEDVEVFLTTFTKQLYELMGKENELIKANETQSNQPFTIALIVLVVSAFLVLIIISKIGSFVLKILKK